VYCTDVPVPSMMVTIEPALSAQSLCYFDNNNNNIFYRRSWEQEQSGIHNIFFYQNHEPTAFPLVFCSSKRATPIPPACVPFVVCVCRTCVAVRAACVCVCRARARVCMLMYVYATCYAYACSESNVDAVFGCGHVINLNLSYYVTEIYDLRYIYYNVINELELE